MKIDYYTKRLLSENTLAIITLVILTMSVFGATWFFISQYMSNRKSEESLNNELIGLNRKKDLMEYKKRVLADEIDLDEVNQILTQLIPLKEDYFSIVVALKMLSQESKFIINGYTIMVNSSTPTKLVLIVEGTGDQNTFLEFLKNYNFGGGRLITIDKIDFNQESYIGSKITLHLYSGKETSVEPMAELTEEDKALIRTILSKVEIEIKGEENGYEPYS